MKRMGFTKILLHIYVFASVLALLFTFANQDASRKLYAVGAHSWWIALVVGSAENTNTLVSSLLFIWCTVFPILLIIFYIMAYKKDLYTPFCVITTIDSIISLSWFVHCALSNTSWHTYAEEMARPDAVVSIFYSIALVISIIISKGPRGRRFSCPSPENEINPG